MGAHNGEYHSNGPINIHNHTQLEPFNSQSPHKKEPNKSQWACAAWYRSRQANDQTCPQSRHDSPPSKDIMGSVSEVLMSHTCLETTDAPSSAPTLTHCTGLLGGAHGSWVVPHEIVAHRQGSIMFSVLEGIGRTLKGRDLTNVRNAVWRITGFSG